MSGLDNLLRLFRPLARQAEARPICWISGSGDAGTDYCPDCARWKAKHLRRRGVKGATADGGWDHRRESDSPSFCGGCDHLLGYSLSEYAFGEELVHWSSDAVVEAITPIHAYEICEFLDGAREYGTPVQVAETIEIATKLAALLPLTPTPEA